MQALAQLLKLAEDCKKDVNGLYDNHMLHGVDKALIAWFDDILEVVTVCKTHGYDSMLESARADGVAILDALRVYQLPHKFGYTYA